LPIPAWMTPVKVIQAGMGKIPPFADASP